MNMPLNEEKKVNFTTTLFALIRTSLSIKMLPQDGTNKIKTYKYAEFEPLVDLRSSAGVSDCSLVSKVNSLVLSAIFYMRAGLLITRITRAKNV